MALWIGKPYFKTEKTESNLSFFNFLNALTNKLLDTNGAVG
jgi:hypothetical protein